MAEHLSHSLQTTSPFRDGAVTVSANLDRLKADFTAEARRQTHASPKRAESLADKLKVFFEGNAFDQHIAQTRKIQNSGRPISALLSSTLWQLEKLNHAVFGNPFGYTAPEVDFPAVYIRLTGFQNFSNLEVDQISLIQRTYTTWRHERTHLIQLLDPNFKSAFSRYQRLNELTAAAAFAGLTAAEGAALVNHPMYPWALAAFAIPNYLLSQPLPHLLWYRLNNQFESEAREQGRKGQNLPSLFEFDFSK